MKKQAERVIATQLPQGLHSAVPANCWNQSLSLVVDRVPHTTHPSINQSRNHVITCSSDTRFLLAPAAASAALSALSFALRLSCLAAALAAALAALLPPAAAAVGCRFCGNQKRQGQKGVGVTSCQQKSSPCRVEAVLLQLQHDK